jgi:hypothetical protein
LTAPRERARMTTDRLANHLASPDKLKAAKEDFER